MTTISPEELPSCVTEGALFMDAIDPEWFWIVDPETLVMLSGMRCVLGQHHPTGGGYRPSEYRIGESQYDDVALGFRWHEDWDYDDVLLEDWNRLWRDEINDRRAAWLAKHDEGAAAR